MLFIINIESKNITDALAIEYNRVHQNKFFLFILLLI